MHHLVMNQMTMPYSLDADHYHKNSAIQKSLAQQHIQKLNISSRDCVLDIGCGDGVVTQALAQLAHQGLVIGIDASSAMINKAKCLSDTSTVANVTFEAIPFEHFCSRHTFSLVTAFSSLYWVNQPLVATLSKVNRLVTQHGRFSGFTFPRESEFWQPFMSLLGKEKWQPLTLSSPYRFWQPSERYKAHFTEAGFAVSLEENDLVAKYDSIDLYQNYVLGWLPCLIGQVDHDDFLGELVDVICGLYLLPCGKIEIPYKKLDFFATKI